MARDAESIREEMLRVMERNADHWKEKPGEVFDCSAVSVTHDAVRGLHVYLSHKINHPDTNDLIDLYCEWMWLLIRAENKDAAEPESEAPEKMIEELRSEIEELKQEISHLKSLIPETKVETQKALDKAVAEFGALTEKLAHTAIPETGWTPIAKVIGKHLDRILSSMSKEQIVNAIVAGGIAYVVTGSIGGAVAGAAATQSERVKNSLKKSWRIAKSFCKKIAPEMLQDKASEIFNATFETKPTAPGQPEKPDDGSDPPDQNPPEEPKPETAPEPKSGGLETGTDNGEDLDSLAIKKLVSSGGSLPAELVCQSSGTVVGDAEGEGNDFSVSVIDNEGGPIANCLLTLQANNGTVKSAETGDDGVAIFKLMVLRSSTLLASHPHFPAAICEQVDPYGKMEITLRRVEDIGSITINRTGYIPGLNGRLNPILDSSNRTYLYADNIAVNGGGAQPHHFKINVPFKLEDADGTIVHATVKHILAGCTLLQYTMRTKK